MKMKSFMKDTTLQSWTREALEPHEKKITCEGVSNARACATGSSVVFTPTLANVLRNAFFKRSTPQKQQTQQPAGTDDPAQRRVAKHLMFLHCAGLYVGSALLTSQRGRPQDPIRPPGQEVHQGWLLLLPFGLVSSWQPVPMSLLPSPETSWSDNPSTRGRLVRRALA